MIHTSGLRPRLSPTAVMGRPLRCRTCSQLVDLLEIPAPWIPAETYQCGTCLQPVTRRRDMSGYDPKHSPWPEGY